MRQGFLRRFIFGDLRATAAGLEGTPPAGVSVRSAARSHVFFNRIKPFRRIAPRCEETVASSKALTDSAGAIAWFPK